MLKHKRLILFIALAFVFMPLMSAFADTTKYIYDDVNRVIRVESGGGTAIITATAGTNGSISPSGVLGVRSGDSQTFTISPNIGYSIADVLVDGVSVGAVSTYTFTNVIANHTFGCQNLPVRITGANPRYFSTLQAA
jgi:hypothetical protein